jgi:hypothetical protein
MNDLGKTPLTKIICHWRKKRAMFTPAQRGATNAGGISRLTQQSKGHNGYVRQGPIRQGAT